MRVRPAVPADLDAIEGLAGDFADETRWPRRPIDADVRAALDSGTLPGLRILVAEDDAGAPCGFATAYPVADLMDGRGAFLSDLYVAPAARRTGVGRALVGAVADDARAGGARWLSWHVGADGAAAQAFYRAVGADLRAELAVMTLRLDAPGGEPPKRWPS